MGISLPPIELVQALGRYSKEQFSIWLEVIKNPVSVVSRCKPDPLQAFVDASRFGLFVYVLTFLVALPGLVVFYKAKITNPVFILTDFITFVLSIFLFGVLLHLAAKLMLANGRFFHSVLAAVYIGAFWPVIQTTDYLLLPSQPLRGVITGEVTTSLLLIDYVALLFLIILLPTIGIYLVVKTVPVIKHTYSVGLFRATVIAFLAYGLSLVAWQLFMLPLMQGSIKL